MLGDFCDLGSGIMNGLTMEATLPTHKSVILIVTGIVHMLEVVVSSIRHLPSSGLISASMSNGLCVYAFGHTSLDFQYLPHVGPLDM